MLKAATSVGKFFGVAETDSDNLQQWKQMAERKVKKGEFGLSIKRPGSSSSRKFATDAERLLSQIEAVQKIEDGREHQEQEGKTGILNEISLEPKPGPSNAGKDKTKPGPKKSKPTVVFNKMFSEDDNTDDKLVNKTFSNPNTSTTFKNILQEKIKSPDNTKIKPNKLKYEEELNRAKPEMKRITQTEIVTKTQLMSKLQNENKVMKPSVQSIQSDKGLKENSQVQNTYQEDDRIGSFVSINDEGAETDLYFAEEMKKKDEEEFKPEDLVYGREAYAQYGFYRMIERKSEKKELLCKLADKMSEYDWKIQAIDDLITLAKDYYFNPESKNASSWKDLKRRVKRSSSRKLGRTEVRRKLGTLPEYRPFFTCFIIIAQVISFCVVCGLGGFTYIGLEPQLSVETDVQTFMGMETVHKWTPPNVWLGPDQAHIVSVGGMFAPCMRQDIEIQMLYSRQNYSRHDPLGCCEVASRNTAGTTTEDDCTHLTGGVGFWRNGLMCSERGEGQLSVRHVMKPCCFGLKGQCQLLSHKHCLFLGGVFHQFSDDHCSQVNCLSSTCKFGGLTPDSDQPWLPANPNQWWRLPLSLLYHQGIIHVVMVIVAQAVLLTQIERTAGWLRMMIIYLVSGSGALVMSAIFSPYQSHVGGVGAIFGMVGVIFVELVQFWTLIDNPYKELVKILVAVTVFIFCGTLPYLDIFGIFAGFVLGTLTGVIVLPYITFQKWHTRVRIILIAVASPLLICVLFLLFITFTNIQSLDNCEVCKLINCVPYTQTMCDTELWQW